ncbi:MAG: CapA family protein, partial [Thermoleophilia bacterium]
GGEATAGSPATAAGRSPAPETSAGATSAAASPTASPTAAPAPTSVKITAGGDVIGGFGVSGVVDSLGSELFAGVAPYFEGSDHGFVNLESPLTTGGEAQGWKDVVIKGNPGLAPAMAASGIDVVTMANNHAGDLGDSGLLDSIKHCRKNGIAVVGAGKDLKTAMAGTVLEAESGTRTAFLGFTDVLPAGYPATAASPGVAPGRADLSAVKRAIKAAGKKADFVVVGWHWNFEYKRAPSGLESSEGKAAIDSGADVVFAHHPHLLDGVEAYHGGLICYSLGNLVFSGFSGETAQTVLVRVKVTPERIDALLVPVQISSSGVPAVATGSTAESILERVRSLSADLGTTVTISDGRGHVHIRR